MKQLIKYIQKAATLIVCFTITQGYAQNAQDGKAGTAPVQKQRVVSLKVGDPAPPLVAAKWVKGTPVSEFAPGKVYVVEFWATWCGPCRAAMPHLSEIARKYKDKAVVLSFNVKELIAGKDKNADYIAKVERFVSRLGDGMDYNVAADVRENVMWDTWMMAAGLGGIPSSFIVDQAGKIAWIGHPMSLDEVVGMVIDGTFDDAGKQKLAAQRKERMAKYTDLTTKLSEAEKSGDLVTALKLVDEIIAINPNSIGSMLPMKYDLLNRTDPGKARKFAEDAMKKYANDPLTLQSIAMFIVNSKEENGKRPDYALGLKIMKQVAARCDSEDPFATSNLAKAFFVSGDILQAIKTQQKVIDLLNDTSLVEQKQTVKDQAQKDMEEYKAGMKNKAF